MLCSGIGRDDVSLSKYYNFAKDSVFNCVGEIYFKNEFSCSCVLIDKKYIITVGHAFFRESDSLVEDSFLFATKWKQGKHPAFNYLGNIDSFSVHFFGRIYSIKKIYVHEKYNGNPNFYSIDEGTFYDMAIAELTTTVEGIKPALLYEDFDELNKRAIISGFGEVEKANEYNVPDSVTLHKRRKMAGENMIDSVGGLKIGNNYSVIVSDFDAPHSACCNKIGSTKALPLEWNGDAGDCGCGLFINKNGIWKLAGICFSPSYFSDDELYGEKYGKYYGFTDTYNRISVYKDWIKETIKN